MDLRRGFCDLEKMVVSSPHDRDTEDMEATA